MEKENLEKWSPILLNLANNKYENLYIDSIKKQIRNILRSYTGYYDPFCELLQNSMDATEREKILREGDYICRIKLIIDLKNNTIYVADNGVGFHEEEFKTFLSPNISYKNMGETRGNKGVGTTYLAFGFYKLEVFTKTKNYKKYISLDNGRHWVFDNEKKYPIPQVSEILGEDKEFDYSQGSSFKIYFSDSKGESLANLSWRGLDDAESWYSALLTNTPLGFLDMFDNESNILFDLIVIDNNGNETRKLNCTAEYLYMHRFFPSTSQNIKDVLEWQENQLRNQKDTTNIPQKFTRKNSIYKFYTTEEILRHLERSRTLQDNELDIVKIHEVTAYAAFVNSTKRWDDINEKKIKARRGIKVVLPGLQLATSNMIQGPNHQIPLTSNIGYQKQSQVIVHFKNAEPDLGRKGFQPEIKTIAERISATLISLAIRPWTNRLLAADDSSNSNDQKKLTNYEYVREMEEYERKNPLLIKNENFFLPMKVISITAKPQTEQDVIVLFNQLIAGGVIRSIELLSTSSRNQYDGLYRVNIKKPESNHYYDSEKNPLGVNQENTLTIGRNTQPYFLEYKYSFDYLIQDFDNEEKNPTEIGLAVVWTMGEKWRSNYEVISTLLPEYQNRRQYHGFTHEVFYDISGSRKFYCIVLEELIDYLNDEVEYINKYSELYQEKELY